MKRIGLYRTYLKVISCINKNVKGNYNACTIIFHGLNAAFNEISFKKRLEKYFKKLDAIFSFEIDDSTNAVILKVELNSTSKHFIIIDCNECVYLNITQIEQQYTKGRHKCKFFGIRVFHKDRINKQIQPCYKCNGRMFAKRY